MGIKVDKDACIACNACVAECPDGMELQDDGKAGVSNQATADASGITASQNRRSK